MSDDIVIIGGAGKTGRRIAERLRAAGVPHRPASRSSTPAFDWDDEATWPAALAGARAVYVAYAPDLSDPRAAERVGRLGAAAVEAGVRRAVLLSGRGELGALRAEAALAASGIAWTVLRCSWFAQVFSEDVLAKDVGRGAIVLPADPAVGEPFVDADDIADGAVAALTQDGHAGATYELTGPEPVTFGAAAAAITAATGRPVHFESVPADAWRAAAVDDGVPAEEADLLVALFGEVLDGRNGAPQDGVRRLLGRAPRPFAAFARDAAAAGAWEAGAAVPSRAGAGRAEGDR